ncbi:MAG: DedA family protein [Bacteroidetes bacterium]|nr:DedA family protein [Bacteroidota bacterium]
MTLILLNPDWLTDLVSQAGWMGLAAGSFLCATLLPFSSEVLYQGWIFYGQPAGLGFFAASAGNCAGISLNYGMGFWASGRDFLPERVRIATVKTGPWIRKYGTGALFLSVLPVIGDPVTLAAGYFRIRIFWFALIGFGLRILRYGLILVFNF